MFQATGALTVRAISIEQPLASQIASSERWFIESKTRWTYRGPVLIHAAGDSKRLTKSELKQFPTNQIIAAGQLHKCLDVGKARNACERFPRYEGFDAPQLLRLLDEYHIDGPWVVLFAGVEPLAEPVPCEGQAGAWQPPYDVLERVLEQFDF